MKLFIKEDIKSSIYVSVVYYNNDDLNSMQHTDFKASRRYSLSEIMNMCVNAKDIDFDGINNIVVVRYKDKYYIASSGGFSDDRGLFTDLYDIDKYISNIKENTCKLSIREDTDTLSNEERLNLIYKEKDRCIKNSVALRHTFDTNGDKIKGKLVNIKNAVYADLGSASIRKPLIAYFDDNNIHGTIRNNLAKEFCNTFTLDELQDDYLKELDNQAELEKQKEIKRKNDNKLLTDILSDYSNKFKYYDEFEVKSYADETLKYHYRSDNDSDYRYKGLLFDIEISITDDNEYKIMADYYNGIDEKDIVNCIYSKSELYSYLDKVSNKINIAIDNMLAEREVIDSQKQYEQELKYKCYDIINDTAHTYVFKTKRGSFSINGSIRWSNQGEGKFYRTNVDQLSKLLLSKNITTYACIDSKEEVPDNLDTLTFIDIVEN